MFEFNYFKKKREVRHEKYWMVLEGGGTRGVYSTDVDEIQKVKDFLEV